MDCLLCAKHWIQHWSQTSWSLCSNARKQIISNLSILPSFFLPLPPSFLPYLSDLSLFSDTQFLFSSYHQTVINTNGQTNCRVRGKGSPEGRGECWWLLLYVVVKLSETWWSEEVNHLSILKKHALGRGNSQGKGFELGVCLAYAKNEKQVNVAWV